MSDQAAKIFEALSDVDEELLERCNRKTVRKNGTAYRLFQRYGRAMAAGICLIVAGTISWGGYLMVTQNAGTDSSSNGAPAELCQTTQSMAVADENAISQDGDWGSGNGMAGGGAEPAAGSTGGESPSEEDQESKQEAAPASAESGSAADGITASPEAVERENVQDLMSANKAGGMTASGTGNTMTEKDSQAADDKKLSGQEMAPQDSREEIPWKEACETEPFSSYLPTALPAGYEAFSARRSKFPEQWNNMIFKWTEGEHVFSLDMTMGEVVTREEIEQRDGLHEYVAEDFRKELIADSPAGEPLSFTLYYTDGMRIDFNGYVTIDEMWKVVESIR